MVVRLGGTLRALGLGLGAVVTGVAGSVSATPYTENVPAPVSLPLPAEYPAAGGVAIVLTGVNGNVYYQFSDPSGAFVGFQNRGTPTAFRGNPFTINDPIPLECGFASCATYFGGAIARMDVRFSAYDGDTQPGGFDENDISLIMNGFNIGSWSGIQTEATNTSGTQSFGFNTGFGNGTFDTAWFSSTDPALLNNILTTGQTTTQVLDDDPNDNYWDFRRGPTLGDEELRTIAPGYELEKTVNGGATTYLQVGEQITYDYVVRNIGSVRIDNISVVDDKIGAVSCTPTTLDKTAAGGTAEEALCQGVYTVTQEDVDRGTLTNVAVANGDPEFGTLGPLSAEVTMTGPALTSALEIEKEAGVAAFSAVGEVITYTFTVTNTGNSTLSDVVVTDPLIPGLSCDLGTLVPAVPPAAPGPANQGTCSGTYTVTQADLDAFATSGTLLSNTATVNATDPNGAGVMDSDTETVSGVAAAPVVDLQKTATPSTFSAPGDVISYEFIVTNLGNVTWPGPPTLTDALTSDEACPAGAVAPGDFITCTASYTIDLDDMDAGEVPNSATAQITVGGVSASDTDTALATADIETGLEIVKTLASGPNPFDAPLQELVYSYELTNTGNTRISTFDVTDDKVAVTCPAVDVDPGDSVTCTSDPYVVTQADIDAGAVLNTASAVAETPLGVVVTSPETSLSVPADQAPALDMAKTTDPDPIAPIDFFDGATVDYVYTVTNSGNTTITDAVTVTDDQIAGAIACPAGALLPGDSIECRATYTVTGTDVLNGTVVNVASASDGTTTSNTDSVAIPQSGAPGITLTKVADTADFDDLTDVLSYTFTVLNSGETPIAASSQPITINDPLIGTFVCGPQPANLLPTESYSCTATYGPVDQDDIDAGEVVNTASASFPFAGATVTSPDSTATVPANVTPALTLAKTALAADGGATFDTLGEEIVFTLAVTNDSTQTLSSVVVSDPLIPGFSCTITDLAPGVTDTTCEARYAVTQADLDAGEINNEASALGTSPLGVTVQDDDTAQILIDPAAATRELFIEKTADVPAFAAVGDVITYAIEVRNDGNLTLENVVVSDPILGLTCTIGTLLPTESDDSCTGTYTIAQSDIDAGEVFNEATGTADGGISESDDITVAGPTRTEGLVFTKVADGPFAAVGDVVTFTLSVENTGNTTLTNVVVTDDFFDPDLTCNIGSILPGDTDSTCVGTYTILQPDVDAGEITNTAEVNADGIDGKPLPQDDATVVVPGPAEAPSVAVTKVEDDGNLAFGAEGSSEAFTFTVENTGNVTLSNVVIADTQAGFSCTIPTILPGVTVTACPAGGNLEADITITQAMVDAGSLTNSVTVTGDSPNATPVQDSASVTLAGPDQLPVLSIVKTSVGAATFDTVGDTLDYEYEVTNDGNITLTSPITVADDRTTVSCPALPVGGLAPLASITCTASYTVDQDDLDAGDVVNIAAASITQPVVPSSTYPDGVATVTSPDDTVTVSAGQAPAIAITKAIEPGTSASYAATTDSISFEFTVTNTGNVTLTEAITVNDINIPATLACPASGAVSLAPGDSVTCTASWSPEQGDIDAGSFENSATASVDFEGSTVYTDPLNPATATAIAVQTPAMEVAKSLVGIRLAADPAPAVAPFAPFAPGNVADYDYVITNTGNTTMVGPIAISDNLIPAVSCPAGDIIPGGSLTCTGSYTLTTDDVSVGSVTNTATATDQNGIVSTPTSETIPGAVDPALEILKSADVATFDAVGDQIEYTYTVENTSPGTPAGGGGFIRPSFIEPIIVFDDRIVDGAGVPTPIVCTPADGVLDPDEVTTCRAIYTITQADLDAVQADGAGGQESAFVTNNATAETSFGAAEVVSPPAEVTVMGAALPSLSVDKTVSAGADPAAVGDVLTYQITTTNDGNQTISGVTVSDPMLGALGCEIGSVATAPPFTLAPGEAVICSADYTVTQTDVDAQVLTNTAAATGASPDGATVDGDDTYVHPLVADDPEVTVVKTLSDGEPDSAFTALGQEVEFTMTVSNTGNITLTSIDVTDSLVPGTCTVGPLAPGEEDATCTFTYEVTQEDIDTGTISNIATAVAQPATPGAPTVGDTDTVVGQGPDFEPALALNKLADITDFAADGVLITYTFTIANTGNVTLTDQPVLSDPKIPAGNLVCQDIPTGGLLPLAFITCTGTYATTQDDVDDGFVTNVATVTAFNPYDPLSPLEAVASETVDAVRTPGMSVEKTADLAADVAEGDVITYSYAVENTGNVTLEPVVLADDHTSAAGTVALAIEDGGVIASLAPGETVTLDATYTVTQADIDQGVVLANTVTATPTPPTGTTLAPVTDDLAITVEDPAPALEAIKTLPVTPAEIAVGTVLTFEVTVENTGNVSLDTVTLTDTLRRADSTLITPAPTAVFASGDAGTAGVLDVGEVWTYTVAYTVTQGDIDAGGISNSVLAEAVDPFDTPTSDTSDNGAGTGSTPTFVPITAAPAVEGVKTITSSTIAVGETVVFEITIENTGNVTLSAVDVATDTLSRADGTPLALSSGPAFVSANMGSAPGTLMVDEIATYRATYVLQQDDIDAGGIENTATVTGTPPTGAPVTDVTDDDGGVGEDDPTVLSIPADPELSMVKTLASGGPLYSAVDDELVFEFEVTNDGNVTITDAITITDPLITDAGGAITCAPVPLAPGDSLICSGSYFVTQDDLDTGSVTNIASATDGTTISPDDSVTVNAQQLPSLAMLKVADPLESADFIVGATASYTYTVTNDGNVTITDPITISDNRIDSADIVCPAFPPAGIAPGDDYICTASYLVTVDDVALGSVTNNATATDGTVTSPIVSETIPVDGVPALSIDKTLLSVNGDTNVAAFNAVGDTLRYGFTVSNSGEVSFANDVFVNDPLIVEDPLLCFTSTAGTPDLIPGASVTCEGTYVITQDDLDAGEVVNEATASTTFGVGPTNVTSPADGVTTPADEGPAVSIAKSVATLPVTVVDQVLTYTLTISNTGNQTLNSVVGSDPLLPGMVCEAATLDVGDTLICSDTYTVTQDDVDAGSLVNTADVAAISPTGTAVGDDTSLTTAMPASTPSFTLVKSATPDPFGAVGSAVTYTFTVENTGNTTLSDVTITDAIVTPSYECVVPTLPVGASDASCTLSYTITQDDVDAGEIANTAQAVAEDPFGNTPTSEDTIITDGPAFAPGINVVKTASVGGTTVGSIVTFTLVVENTGNVTLSAPAITDTMVRANGTSTSLTTPFVLQSGDGDGDDRLDVTETWIYTATYELGQADLNAGGFENSVNVAANDPSGTSVSDTSDDGDNGDGNTTDDPTVVEIVPGPAVDTQKVLVSGGSVAGDAVVFEITARNVGNVTLTDPVITDTLLRADGGTPTGAVVGPVLTSGNAAGIDPGEAWVWSYTYTLQQADIDAGGLSNTATAGGLPPGGTVPVTDVSDNGDDADGNTADDPTLFSIVPTPELTVVKSVVSTGDAAGELVVFDVVATNTGNVTLSALVIDDTMSNADGTSLTPTTIEVVAGSDVSLDVADAVTYRVSYALTQDDIDSGTVTNSATVTGTSPTGATVSDVSDTGSGDGSTPTQAPITQVDSMEATKDANIPTRIAPDLYEVVFTITVANTGNVTQTDLVIEDDLAPFLAPAVLSGVDAPVIAGFASGAANAGYDGLVDVDLVGAGTSLAPGATGTIELTVRYDTAAGFPAGVNTVSVASSRIGVPVTATASVTSGATPDLFASKSVSPGSARVGDTVTYTLSFQNRLATAEANLTLVDEMPSGLAYVPGSATYNGSAIPAPDVIGRTLQWSGVTIGAGETVTLTLQARVTGGTGELTNEAYVLDPSGQIVSNVATATLAIPVEPVFDCADIIGKVFDDRDMDGYQDGFDPDDFVPITDQGYRSKFGIAPEPIAEDYERGLANVRLSTVTGTIITTDEHGRFSVPCAELPADIGSNFTLKLDTRSLPSGYQVTTENPRVVRVTPGTLTRLNFGATIATVVDIDLMASAFVGNTDQPSAALLRGVDQLVAALSEQPSVLRLTYYRASEGRDLARARMDTLEALIRDRWRGRGGYRLPIERTINRLQ